jgi:hypothetical protein
MSMEGVITKEMYDRLRRKQARYEHARDTRFPESHKGKFIVTTPEMQKALPPDVTNEERSLMEKYLWMRDKPKKYSLYINREKGIATTWTGQRLGRIHLGSKFRDNFGGVRQPVWVYGDNGVDYQGTYFTSTGDVATIRALKKKPEYYEEG